jgi:hypothetical protein
MSPSALIYVNGRESEAGGLGGGESPLAPINVRANNWLQEYNALNKISIEGITPVLRGIALLILRNPSRDLRLVETFLHIESQDNPAPAIQALIRQSKLDKERYVYKHMYTQL